MAHPIRFWQGMTDAELAMVCASSSLVHRSKGTAVTAHIESRQVFMKFTRWVHLFDQIQVCSNVRLLEPRPPLEGRRGHFIRTKIFAEIQVFMINTRAQ
jgi:hypothetical protein